MYVFMGGRQHGKLAAAAAIHVQPVAPWPALCRASWPSGCCVARKAALWPTCPCCTAGASWGMPNTGMSNPPTERRTGGLASRCKSQGCRAQGFMYAVCCTDVLVRLPDLLHTVSLELDSAARSCLQCGLLRSRHMPSMQLLNCSEPLTTSCLLQAAVCAVLCQQPRHPAGGSQAGAG